MTEETDAVPEWGYAYRASLMGAPWEFYLTPDALAWRVGNNHGRVPYGDITFIRMSFRPSTIQMRRYTTEIWSKGGPKLTIASASWKGLVQQETFDAEYSAFLGELHRRIATAGGQPKLRGGSPVFLYWPGLLIFLTACVAFVMLVINGIKTEAGTTTLVLAVFAAILVWQGGMFFYLNRPKVYGLDEPPAGLLPMPRTR